MGEKVELEDIVEAISLQANVHNHYLHKKTGSVVLITEEEFRAARNDRNIDRFPEWQQKNIKTAQEILTTDDYIKLPTQYEIDEYAIMKEFCLSIEDEKVRDIMYNLIQGKGAFRRFKDNIHQYGLADDWYAYRKNEFRKIAINWCRSYEIDYKD